MMMMMMMMMMMTMTMFGFFYANSVKRCLLFVVVNSMQTFHKKLNNRAVFVTMKVTMTMKVIYKLNCE